MFATILGVVGPVFLIVLFGFGCARRMPFDLKEFNFITIELFAPLLIISSLASKEFDLQAQRHLIVSAALIVLGSGVIAWPIAKLAGVSRKTFVPPMMFSNTGNMGLPLAVFAFGQAGLAAAVAMFLVCNLLHFTVGLKILNWQASLKTLVKNNIVWSTLLGLALGTLHIALPEALMRALKLLGEATIPMMLFALGVRMTTTPLTNWRLGLLGGLVCPLSGLVMAGVCVLLLPLSGQEKLQVFLFAGLPPAVFNYMLAERYGQEPDKVASIVLVGNALSVFFIPLALWLGYQFNQ
ncbi:AEC family transporter [Ampullimonas aquatilis]|uniref:AEC family transporter n=1 Tax=Ampullimonas aquatilis TaxID=1341549 RepID=UPI003C7370FE